MVVGKKSIDSNNAIFRIRKAVNEFYLCKKELRKYNRSRGGSNKREIGCARGGTD